MSTAATVGLDNPFPGLRPFREDEEHLFFGRESQVDTMVDKLVATRFLAVVGTSGSGKSSLVNCGLRPALHRGLMAKAGTAWRMAQFRPGRNPIHAMARALAEDGVLFAGPQPEGLSLVEILEATLRMSNVGLVDVCEQAQLGEGVNLLAVVDQFEELFRYRKAGEDATAFVNLLLEAKVQTTFPIYIVLTMRSDFLGDCAQFPGLAEAINQGQYLVPRMTREERRAAIAGPIGVGGAAISPVLLTRLVNDVGDNPDQLSILQHALNRTWARWQEDGRGEGPLSLPHYEAVGAMAHALDQHAEEAYAELASERHRTICEKIFKALTDRGTDARGIRRPTSLATLCALAGASPAEVTEVIDVFRKPSRSFLMPPLPEVLEPETVIDISHESLMRVWERLKVWTDEEAQSAQLYRRLSETAALYAAGKAGLWGDPDLQFALDWREREKPTAAWAELYCGGFDDASSFLIQSEAQQARDQREKEDRQRRELEQAQALAAEKAKSARLFRIGFAIAVVLTLLAAGTAVWAIKQRAAARENARRATVAEIQAKTNESEAIKQQGIAKFNAAEQKTAATEALRQKGIAEQEKSHANEEQKRAEEQALLADSRRLAAESTSHLQDQLDLALLLGVQASGTAPTFEAQGSLVKALRYRPALSTFLRGHKGNVDSVAFSPDGTRLASGSADKKIILWDTKTGKALQTLEGHKKSVLSVAFSPDGARLASASADHTIILWDAKSGKALQTLEGHKDSVGSVAFSPDGARLASASVEIILWDAKTGKALQTLEGHENPALNVAFSPDGARLASGSLDHTIILWDAKSGKALQTLEGHKDYVGSVAFSPDGARLASGSADDTIILWDAKSGKALQTLKGHVNFVLSVAFSPDGTRLASGSHDKTIILWDDIDLVSSQKRACHMANRNLTAKEWADVIGPEVPYRRTCPDLPPGEGAPEK